MRITNATCVNSTGLPGSVRANASISSIIRSLVIRQNIVNRTDAGYQAIVTPYNDVLRRTNVPAIDLPGMMRQRHVDAADLVDEDGFHLSIRGNHLYADMILEALTAILA